MDEQPLRVLIVNHSADDVSPLVEVLKEQGFSFLPTTVSDRAGLRQALDKERWELILCNCDVPDIHPSEAMKMARDLERDVPFVVVASKEREDIARKVLREGADDYIAEGGFDRLDDAMYRVLRAARDRAELRGIRRMQAFQGDFSQIVRNAASLEEIFSRMATVIPQAWPYPDIAGARVQIDDRLYVSDGFTETPWKLVCEITGNGAGSGRVER